jgi:hypothetical protein
MAPEQVQGLDIDARADIYAMGVVLYRLLTAEFPFEATTPFAMTQSHVHEMPRPIEHVRPDVPVEVRDIVARALAKAPGERFQSALEFRDALAGWLRPPHDSSPSREPAVTQMMARPSTMGRGTSYPRPLQVAAAGVVSAGLVVGGISAAMWRHSPPERPDPTRSAAVATFDSEPATPTGAATPPRKSVGVVQASVTGTTAGKTRRERPAAEVPDLQPTVPLTQFSNVKLLVVNDGRTKESGVLLTFSNRRLEAMPREGGTPAAILPYGGIAKATYVHARDPQWDPQLSSPAGKINVPGILGRLRHWLVVQTRTDHAILRLDGPDWAQVLTTFTARTGVAIDRPLAADRQRPESDQLGRPNRKP